MNAAAPEGIGFGRVSTEVRAAAFGSEQRRPRDKVCQEQIRRADVLVVRQIGDKLCQSSRVALNAHIGIEPRAQHAWIQYFEGCLTGKSWRSASRERIS